jgi:predicted PurR-regulated permease PerM
MTDARPGGGRSSVPVSGGVALLLLGGLCWFLYSVRAVMAPFLLAAVLAYLLNPLVSFLETRGVRREKAVLVLFISILSLITALAYWGLVVLWQDLPELNASWPTYMRQAEEAMRKAQSVLEFEWPYFQRTKILERTMNDTMAWVQLNLWHSSTVVTSVLRFAVNLFLAPFIAFFFLRGGARTAQMALDACPGSWVERFLSLLNKFGEVFGNYARGVILEAFLVGVLTVGGLHWIGLDYAAMIGVATGAANMIPYFGPVLGGAVGLVAAIFQFSNLMGPTRVVIVFVVIHYIDSWILQPLIMKRAVDLNPVTVVFALLCGAQLGGVWGLIFAVPVAGLLKEAGTVFYVWYRAERGLIVQSKEFALAAARPWVV